MAQTTIAAGSLEGMEERAQQAAQLESGRHPRAGRPRMGLLAQGLLAHLELSRPRPRPTQRLLGRHWPERVRRTVPPHPGCDANRRMRTRTSGGVGGARVSLAPTRLT